MRWVTFDCFGTLVDWNAGFAAILRPLVGDKTPEVMRVYHRLERQLEIETPHRLYKDVLTTGLRRAAEEIGVPLSEPQARTLPERWGTLPAFADASLLSHAVRSRRHGRARA
jgi:2-haloacid dehalogenase